ncbi:MAG TPA: hypothetical protein VN698_02435 [Bacteroidia bacterium]|nr:hypothetical protein [Bacteroidia bacterium]
MGREIRRVPANWQHPKYIRETYSGYILCYKAMCQWSYDEAIESYKNQIEEFKEAYNLYKNGFIMFENHCVTIKDYCQKYIDKYLKPADKKFSAYEKCWLVMEHGLETGTLDIEYIFNIPKYPDPQRYMPTGEWYQLYETVSEGTPLSPPFETADQLIDWLSNNLDYRGTQWSREAATNILKVGFAVSLIVNNGEMYTPEQQHLIKEAQND